MKAILRGIPIGPLGPPGEPEEAKLANDLTTRYRCSGQVFHDFHDRLFAEFFEALDAGRETVQVTRVIVSLTLSRDNDRDNALQFFAEVLRLRGYQTDLSLKCHDSVCCTTVTVRLRQQ